MGKLGDTLRERRIALGITLAEAEDGTRIRARLIEALEDGEYARLPNPGYVRGYISSYARFLNLDPLPLLALYKSETGAGRYHELNLPQTDEAVVPTGQQHAMPVRAGAGRGPRHRTPRSGGMGGGARLERAGGHTARAGRSKPVSRRQRDRRPLRSQTPSPPRPPPLRAHCSRSPSKSWSPRTARRGSRSPSTTRRRTRARLTGGQGKRFEVAKSATVLVGKPSSVTILRDGKRVKIPASDDTPTVVLKARPAQ